MGQPLGYEEGKKGTLVCKVKQSIYGLVLVVRIWYNILVTYLHHISFHVCDYDLGLFIHTKQHHLYLISYVDDFKIIVENHINSY